MNKISNQFAAMPSVHCAWALVVRVRARPTGEARLGEGARVLYPVATVTVIVITANHYFLDAVGGFVVARHRLRRRPPLHPRRPWARRASVSGCRDGRRTSR